MLDESTVLGKSVGSALAGETGGLFACCFFLLGFACLWSMLYQIRIRGWPSTTGRMTEAGVKKFGPYKADVSSQQYKTSVGYEYEVNGAKYLGRHLSAWTVVASHNMKFILQRQLGDLREADSVMVYYNPSRPSRAYLKQPGLLGMFVTLLLSIPCFATPWLVFG